MTNPAPEQWLLPGVDTTLDPESVTVVDIREPEERIGNPDWIQRTPNVPSTNWEMIPEKFPDGPVVLCCAAGIRTRQCLALLNFPEDVYAWTLPIQDIPEAWRPAG